MSEHIPADECGSLSPQGHPCELPRGHGGLCDYEDGRADWEREPPEPWSGDAVACITLALEKGASPDEMRELLSSARAVIERFEDVRRPDENKHFNGLSPADAEALTLISEECAEVIQAIAKIQRHGLWSQHPESRIPNYRTLQREVGDLLAALRVGEVQNLIDWGNVIQARDAKLFKKLPKYLHHAKVTKDE